MTGPVARVSDAAVRDATGRTWPEWFALLDDAGAARMTHREIVAVLAACGGLSGWWRQSVTVAYEQERGLRAPNQMADGYQVSASRTMAVPVKALFRAWIEPELRRAWLADAPLSLRTAAENRSARFTWGEGPGIVAVHFTPKGPERAAVAIHHGRLPGPEEAARMKEYWRAAADRLRARLEEDAPEGEPRG